MLGYPPEMWRETPVMLSLVSSDAQYLRRDQLTFSFCFISRSLLSRLCSGSLLLGSSSSVSSMSSSITLLYLRLLFPRRGRPSLLSSCPDGCERFLILSLLLGLAWPSGARTMSMWGSLRSVVMSGGVSNTEYGEAATHQSPRAEPGWTSHCVVRNYQHRNAQCVVRCIANSHSTGVQY